MHYVKSAPWVVLIALNDGVRVHDFRCASVCTNGRAISPRKLCSSVQTWWHDQTWSSSHWPTCLETCVGSWWDSRWHDVRPCYMHKSHRSATWPALCPWARTHRRNGMRQMCVIECVACDLIEWVRHWLAAMQHSLTRTGSSPMQGECGHEQIKRVAPHDMFTCANVCLPVSLRSMSPTHRRCAAQSPGKFAAVGSRKLSRFDGEIWWLKDRDTSQPLTRYRDTQPSNQISLEQYQQFQICNGGQFEIVAQHSIRSQSYQWILSLLIIGWSID